MHLSIQDAQRLAQEGHKALQQGRSQEARQRFEAVAKAGHANAQVWLLLAIACRALNDAAAEEAAANRLLEIAPQSVRGLIMKADCRARAADERTAVLIYKKALRIGSDQPLPESDHAELRRAEAIAAQLDARFAAHVDDSLAAMGLPAEDRSARFQRSLDIMAGRKQIFLQEPTGYYFPELPQIQFYDPAAFEWAPAIEAAAGAIRAELRALLEEGLKGFKPYIRTEPHQPRYHPLLDRSDWSAFFLAENGTRFEEAIARCPVTWKAVQGVPLPWVERWMPTIMFSLLRPKTRIPAHTGVLNTRLICHLPLIVPPGCGFRVGNEVRQWEEGKLLIFDDTIEHEAWNDSDEDRVVLIFDIWRPELSTKERREVAALCSLSGEQPGGG